MTHFDDSIGYALWGAMVVAFIVPLAISFLTQKAWMKFDGRDACTDASNKLPLSKRVMKWCSVAIALYICYVLLWLTVPSIASLFSLAVVGAFSGHCLSYLTKGSLIRSLKSRLLSMGFGLFLAIVVALVFLRVDTTAMQCPKEQRVFGGTPYDVEICSLGGDDFHSDRRIRIYAKKGELLAQRTFTVLKVPGSESSLNVMNFEDSQIVYTDADPNDQVNVPPKFALKMPPSWWDWLIANADRLLFSP